VRPHTDARFDQNEFVDLASAGPGIVVGKEAIHFQPWHAAAAPAGECSVVIDGRLVAWELPKMNVAVDDRRPLESGSSACQDLAACPAMVRHLELRYEHGI